MPNSHDIEYKPCPFPEGETDTHLNCPTLQIVLVGLNKRPMVFLGVVTYVPSVKGHKPVQAMIKPGDYVLAPTKIHGYDSHGLRFLDPGRVQYKPRRES